MVDRYLIDKKPFDLNDTNNYIYMFFYGFGSVAIIAIETMIYKRFWRFNAYGREAAKNGMIWNSLMKIGSATIWFLVKANYFEYSIRWAGYIAIAAVLLIILLVYSLNGKFAGGSSKVFVLMSSATLMTLIVLAFAEETWMKGNINPYLAVMLPSMIMVYVLFLIIEPPVSWISARAFAALSSAISIYTIVVWAVGNYIGKALPLLPFSINELLMIPILTATFVLMMATIYSSLKSYSSINFNIGKIIKTQNPKGVKHGKK